MREELNEEQYLKRYDPQKYRRPSVAADAIVFGYRAGRLQVLLVQRKNHPFKGCWCIPGGFVEVYEDPDDAVRRELKEETGIEVGEMSQLGAFGRPDRDPRYHVISIAYVGVARPEETTPRASDDAADAAWHPVRRTPPLAFDHESVLKAALKRLREEAKRPSMARRFLGRRFTGGDFHALYEEILGARLDRGRFLRRLAGACRESPRVGEPVRFDPAKLRRLEDRLGAWWL